MIRRLVRIVLAVASALLLARLTGAAENDFYVQHLARKVVDNGTVRWLDIENNVLLSRSD